MRTRQPPSKIKFGKEQGPRPPACGAKKTPRSVVTCERDAGHDQFHAGRTRSGHWKVWDV